MYLGPKEVGATDDLLEPIVKFINGAKKQLYISVQELDSEPIARAIVDACKRKVLVKLVLEADYLRANIKVNSDFNPHIFHQKFIIRDGESVLTGSTNFTTTGVSANLNHVVIIHDKRIAKIYEREFAEIQEGCFGKENKAFENSAPAGIPVSGVRVKTLFAPDHDPEMEIMKQIAKAKSRIDFAIFTFVASSGIDDQLVLVRNAGLPVRGAFFASQANQKWSAKKILQKAQAELYLVPKDGLPKPAPRKLHHKLMVIDEQLIIAGGFNYTGPANYLNDEKILIIGDLDKRPLAKVI